jgi:hypothetical protein
MNYVQDMVLLQSMKRNHFHVSQYHTHCKPYLDFEEWCLLGCYDVWFV